MKTNLQTTYILLERGSEDQQLLSELRHAFSILTKTRKDAAIKYPRICELMDGLSAECRDDE